VLTPQDLLRREEDAKRARKDAMEQRKAAAAEESVRDAGRRMVEERRKRQEAAAAAAREAEKPPTPPPRAGPPPISSQDLTIKLDLPPGTTQEALESALKAYGAIEAVHVLPAKKKKGPKAIVEFKAGNWGGCWACMHDGAGVGATAKWLSGEPAWVAWAAQQKEREKEHSNGFGSAPDFGEAADRQRQREEDAAMESATLLRMRQRERERLAEEIRRAEEDE
jgi:DnaJ family protein C protein 17